MKLHVSEHDIQKSFFQWCDLRGVFAFAIPNQMRPAQIGRKKAEGMRAGVPDVFVPGINAPIYKIRYGLFIEFKAKGGKTSPRQKNVQEFLVEKGYAVATCFSTKEGANAVCRYFGWREDL